jgi:hypothetical protein
MAFPVLLSTGNLDPVFVITSPGLTVFKKIKIADPLLPLVDMFIAGRLDR